MSTTSAYDVNVTGSSMVTKSVDMRHPTYVISKNKATIRIVDLTDTNLDMDTIKNTFAWQT